MAKRFRAKRRKEPEPKRPVPRYCGPHATGQAYSIWPAGTPKSGKPKYHGVHGTPESRENYRRWLAELKCDPTGAAGSGERPLLTVAEWWEQWLKWVAERGLYQKHGEQTGTLLVYQSAMTWVLPIYGSMFMTDFGPYHLNIIRERMVDEGLARITINGYIAKIKRIWRRAAAKGFISREDYVALDACEALHEHEGGVRQNESYQSLRLTLKPCCTKSRKQSRL
jgi:hypothetical protein